MVLAHSCCNQSVPGRPTRLVWPMWRTQPRPAVTTTPNQPAIQLCRAVLATAPLLFFVACSSAPIPSFDERQPDDIVQSKAAQSVATSRAPAATAPNPQPSAAMAAATAATKPNADAESEDRDGHDAGARDRDAALLDADDGDAGNGETISTDDTWPSAPTEPDSGVGWGEAGLSNTREYSQSTGDTGLTGDFGSEPAATTEPLQEVLPFGETICPATFLDELHYAEGNEFWLGDQSEVMFRVDGFGYFAAQGADGAMPARRYTRNLALSVRSDGTLEDHAGYEVLGYSPAADDTCLTTLRAPLSLPARPTTALALTANLESQSDDPGESFDVSKPAASAIAAPFSVPLVDVDGRMRSLAVYVEHTGAGSFRYHVLVPQNDVIPGTTGFEELGFGDLQFDADGALVAESSPLLCVGYAGASAQQCFTVDFGRAIADDGATGPESSTSKESSTTLIKLTSDGYPAGTSTKLSVDAKGVVSVVLDNGQSRGIGSLALARFPNEGALAAVDTTTFRQTTASGTPAFAAPASPGRGTVTR